MSYTFGDVMRAARDRSTYFARSRIPGGPAARNASAVQRDLLMKGAQRAPDRFALTTTIAIQNPPQVGIAQTLPANLLVERVETDFLGGLPTPEKTRMIPVSRKYDYDQDRAVYLLNGSLYMTGQAADWANVTQLTVFYVPLPNDFAAETDAVTLPDDAKEALVSRLALTFALHVNGMPYDARNPTSQPIQVDVGSFQALAAEAEHAWLASIVTQVRQARTSNRNSLYMA